MLLTYAYDVLINEAVLMLLTYAYDVLINVAVLILLTYDVLINVAVFMLLRHNGNRIRFIFSLFRTIFLISVFSTPHVYITLYIA
jgi:hypothetical protein